MKAHGVAVAMPQEQSWAPTPVDRSCGERGVRRDKPAWRWGWESPTSKE